MMPRLIAMHIRANQAIAGDVFVFFDVFFVKLNRENLIEMG